jgi:hypothetical protein
LKGLISRPSEHFFFKAFLSPFSISPRSLSETRTSSCAESSAIDSTAFTTESSKTLPEKVLETESFRIDSNIFLISSSSFRIRSLPACLTAAFPD